MSGSYSGKPSPWTTLHPDDLTPEAVARRKDVARRMNRCKHDVNVVQQRCLECEREGLGPGHFVGGPTHNG